MAIEVVLATQVLDRWPRRDKRHSRCPSSVSALTFAAELTEVVAGGDRLPDADGGRSSRDDDHLVVALNTKETKSLNYLPPSS